MILHSELQTTIKYGSFDISGTSKTDVASFKKLDTHQILRFYYQLVLGKGLLHSNHQKSIKDRSFFLDFQFQKNLEFVPYFLKTKFIEYRD
jgi:hypothetical protein